MVTRYQQWKPEEARLEASGTLSGAEQTEGLLGASWGRMRGVNPCLGSHLPNFPQMLSPTYKQRNEDFRKLFSKLPEAERLIVGESWCLPCPGRRP